MSPSSHPAGEAQHDPPRVQAPRLKAEAAAALDRDGCMVLTGVIPADWIAPLRSAFEAGYRPPGEWPVPRGPEFRHAMVDADPFVQRVCRLPAVLAAAAHIIGQPFFLAQVEGREPRAGLGHQKLHRDGHGGPHRVLSALAFLDPFGPENGATRVAPGTHNGEPADGRMAESRARFIKGNAGDILLIDTEVLHGGSRNISGAPRRSLLFTYFAEVSLADHLRTRSMRGVGMEVAEIFVPALLAG